VVKDAATGQVLVEAAAALGVVSNNVAEYEGLVAGLSAAHRINPSANIHVRMDSKLVVEQMSGRWQIKHPDMRVLAARARAAHPPQLITYTWIPRAQNTHADRLANEAMDAAASGRVWAAPASASSPSERSTPGDKGPAAATPVRPSSSRAPSGPDLGPPTTLLLVRHGRTELTEQGRFSGGGGSLDPELSEAGRRDAIAVAELLAATTPTPDVIVTSPMTRTRQTAAVIAAHLRSLGRDETPLTTPEPRIDQDWVEASFGDWDGATYAEVTRQWPAELAAWQGSTTVAPPGGESLDAVLDRVGRARHRLITDHPGRCVVVVSHVTPIRAVVHDALNAAAESLWRLVIAPASVTALRYWPDGGCEVRGVSVTTHPTW
jgi:probable phosphoglycerate mutase